jgi:hypothetical protein
MRTSDLLIHVINYSGLSGNGCLEPVPIHDALLTLRGCEGMTCRALVADAHIPLSAGDTDDACIAQLPPIGTFEVLWLAKNAE